LRSDDCQRLLARLASLPNTYVVATCDNASVAPLLWDQKCAAQFNFHYFHVPTYCCYEDELMYQDDIAFEENDGRRLQAASVVLSSLTQTARTVFRQLAEFQLSDHPGGLPFSALFTVCREQLILSNEITLRSHLEEFIDHDLCCMNDSSESVGLYKIPLRTNDIQSCK
jgi:origin recognition complex subunit 2